MRTINTTVASIVAAVLLLGGAVGAVALFAGGSTADRLASADGPRPVWTEVRWPFAMDPWGKGKAFRCKASECGTEVNVYLRAKLGFCNCVTGIADDADLDRMGDLYLLGADVLPSGTGRPITVGSMQGRSRIYRLTAPPGQSVVSIAFNERCDMIVATALLQHDRSTAVEPAIIEFLNTRTVLHWAEVTLGL